MDTNILQLQAAAAADARRRRLAMPAETPPMDLGEGLAPDAAPVPGADAAEVLAGSMPIRALLGVASPIMGAAQKATEFSGDEKGALAVRNLINRLEAMKKKGGLEGEDIAGMGGSMFSPIPTGKVSTAAGWFSRMIQAAKDATISSSLQPVTDKEQQKDLGTATLNQAAGGAIAGVGTSGVASGGKGLYNLVEPYFKSGVEKIIGRTANAAAGDRKQSIIDALVQPRQIVPGSHAGPTRDISTAAEAATPAGSAEFSALGKMAARRNPSDYNAIEEAQAARRANAVQTIAGGTTKEAQEKAVKSAVKTRFDATDPIYEEVKDSKARVRAITVVDMIRDHLAINKNEEAITVPLKEIEKKLVIKTENGAKIENEVPALVSLSHDIKRMIDSKNPDGKPQFNVSVLTKIKKELDERIGKAEPKYLEARNKFKELSGPVNKLQLGGELEDKLIRPSGMESPNQFVGAVDDAVKTIKDATGQRSGSLNKMLNPGEVASVNSVVNELLRKQQNSKLATLGMPAATEKMGQELPKPAQGFNLLDRGFNIARSIYNRLQGKAEGVTLDKLAEAMKSPSEMARLMQAATPDEKKVLLQAVLMQRVPQVAGTVTGRSLGGSYTGGH